MSQNSTEKEPWQLLKNTNHNYNFNREKLVKVLYIISVKLYLQAHNSW